MRRKISLMPLTPQPWDGALAGEQAQASLVGTMMIWRTPPLAAFGAHTQGAGYSCRGQEADHFRSRARPRVFVRARQQLTPSRHMRVFRRRMTTMRHSVTLWRQASLARNIGK